MVMHSRPWPSGQAPAFHAGQAGSTPAGRSRESANGRPPDFESGDGGSNPPSRIREAIRCGTPGRSRLVATPGSEPGGAGSIPAPGTGRRLGRQLADHSRSDREMLRVRIPPEPSRARTTPAQSVASRRAGLENVALVEQSGVLAALSGRRPRVRIPPGALADFRSTPNPPGAAGARSSLMRTASPDRHRGLGLV